MTDYEKSKYKTIGVALSAAISEESLTIRKVADHLGCSSSLISMWTQGARRIYAVDLERLSVVLNRPITYFFNFTPKINAKWVSGFSPEAVQFVTQEMAKMAEYGFAVKLLPSNEFSNFHRLFPRIIQNADNPALLDRKSGGIESERDLRNLITHHALAEGVQR